MQVMKKNDSIDYLKAIAAVLVVTHHAILYSGADVTAGILEKLFTLIISVHVPLFFMVAGYLCRRQPLKEYFRKKLSRIFVPFVTFSVLKIVYSVFVSDTFAHGDTLPEQLVDAFLYGGTYWFPYAILLCYGLAVIVWHGGKWGTAAAFAALVAVNLAVELPRVKALSYVQLGNALCYGCFFLAGMALRQWQEPLQSLFRKYKWAVLILCGSVCAALMYAGADGEDFAKKLPMALALAVLLYALADKLPRNLRMLQTVGKYSLQIMFFDSLYKVLIFGTGAYLEISVWILLPLEVALGVALSCAGSMLIEKIPGVRRLFGL